MNPFRYAGKIASSSDFLSKSQLKNTLTRTIIIKRIKKNPLTTRRKLLKSESAIANGRKNKIKRNIPKLILNERPISCLSFKISWSKKLLTIIIIL